MLYTHYKQNIEKKTSDNNLRQAWHTKVYRRIGKSFLGSEGDNLAFENE